MKANRFGLHRILAATLSIAACAAQAQSWPSKPVEFVVHSGAGGGPDQFVRVVTETITHDRLLAQPVVVNNRVGGGGSVAFSFIKSKHGDPHYVLGIGTGTLLTQLQVAKQGDLFIAADDDREAGMAAVGRLHLAGLCRGCRHDVRRAPPSLAAGRAADGDLE